MARPTQNQLMEFLDQPFWPEGLDTTTRYFRTEDDCDGGLHEGLVVTFSEDGDAWIQTIGSSRFRTGLGGGRSLRVRAAILLLAMAIQADNEDRPILPEGGK